jgi:maleylacetate reductase
LERLPAEAEQLELRRVVLISTASARVHADMATEELAGRVVARINGVRQHVPEGDVRNALRIAFEANADALIAIGGGSTTGLAKAVALETRLPIVAVPTTYSGSEMTPIYGITSGGRKHTGRDPSALPRTVVYDPVLTVTMPAGITASSGMNALAHSIEAMYSHEVSPVVEMLAEESIRVLARGLPGSVARPQDIDARTDALYGAYLAGSVLSSAGMAIHHTISHVLGGNYGLDHGRINSALLPHVVAFNAPAAPRAMARIARALDVPDPAPALYDLASAMGAPTSLKRIGMKKEDLPEAARQSTENAKWNPRPVNEADVNMILAAALEGGRPRSPGRDDSRRRESE